MSDGRTHAKWTRAGLILLVLPSAAVVAYTADPVAGAAIAVGGMLGHRITPDMDIPWRTYEEKRIYRTAGPVVGRIWQAYWAPYSVLIPHRSWTSHLPVLGTALRLLYLCWPLLLFIPRPWPEWGTWFVFCLWMAWSFQDLIHFALDDFRLISKRS